MLGGLYNGVDMPKTGGVGPIDATSGKVTRRSMISRNGHRIDLLDDDGRTEGISVTSGDGKLSFVMDTVNTKITVHSDGSVTIEGKNGIVVDAGTGKLEMKASQISMSAQSGVTVDGGAGAVSVQTGADLSLKGTNATLQGSAQTTVSGGAMCSVSAGPSEDQLVGRKDDAMPPAARVGDATGHPGVIAPPGVPTVLIGGMPAATVGTPHICSFPPPAVHPPTAIAPPGCPTVLIGGMPAARSATWPRAARRSSSAR